MSITSSLTENFLPYPRKTSSPTPVPLHEHKFFPHAFSKNWRYGRIFETYTPRLYNIVG